MNTCEICDYEFKEALHLVGGVWVCNACRQDLEAHMESLAMFKKTKGYCQDLEDVLTVAGGVHELLDLIKCTCELCDVDYQPMKEKLLKLIDEEML